MTSIPSYNDAVFAYDKLCSKLSILNKKMEAINHQIAVEEAAFELRKQPIDEDKGYNYYLRERDSAVKALENTKEEIENKITKIQAQCDIQVADLEQKKASAILDFERKIEALKACTEAKITALDRKKESSNVEYQRKIDYHQSSIMSITNKFQTAKPTSTIYSKQVSNKEQTQREIDDLNGEVQQALVVLMAAQRKDMEKRQKEEMNKQRMMEREQFLRDEDERARIRQQRENERKAEEERARQRCEAAKALNAALEEIEAETKIVVSKPIKKSKNKLSFPLDPKKKYTVDELDTIEIDWERDGDENCELWEKLRHEAAEREGISGAEAWRKQLLSPE